MYSFILRNEHEHDCQNLSPKIPFGIKPNKLRVKPPINSEAQTSLIRARPFPSSNEEHLTKEDKIEHVKIYYENDSISLDPFKGNNYGFLDVLPIYVFL
ncbi:hypothetical protein J6590_072905 [Homalodisca vitripennis]|nr:hypothetical protein J6590_072905 [Homalodisca vitripennis]